MEGMEEKWHFDWEEFYGSSTLYHSKYSVSMLISGWQNIALGERRFKRLDRRENISGRP